MAAVYPGMYLATVESTADPEKRFRVRIRAQGVHDAGAPVDGLPWAENCSATGRLCGDFFPYHKGDVVFVMFMAGHPSRPVVMGGRTSTANEVTDAPLDYQSDVSNSEDTSDYRRWERTDRAGNRVVLSEKGSELHVLLESGGASVEVSRRNDGIVIKASGNVLVDSARVRVHAGVAEIEANDVIIDATDGRAALSSDTAVDVSTTNTIPGLAEGDVNLGGVAPRLRGIALPATTPGTIPRQSDRVNLRGKNVNIGVGTEGVLPPAMSIEESLIDFDGAAPLLPTLNITLRSMAKIALHTAGSVDVNAGISANVTAPSIGMTGSVTVTGPFNVEGASSLTGNVTLLGNLTAPTGTIQALMIKDMLETKLTTHVHTSTAPGNPTTPPTPGT